MASEAVAGSASELATLYPVPKQYTIAGRKVEIPAGSIRHCTEVWQRGFAIAATFEDGVDEYLFAEDKPDEAADLLEFATGIDRDWLLGLSPFDKVEVVMAWLEVNGPFFVQRLPQARQNLRTRVAGIFGLGLTQSSTPVSEAIPTPPSTRRPPSTDGSPSSIALNSASAASAS